MTNLDDIRARLEAAEAHAEDGKFTDINAREFLRIAIWLRDTIAAKDALVERLVGALEAAEYAIRHASGETVHPSSRGFDYEDFQVWAEHWLQEAREALRTVKGGDCG